MKQDVETEAGASKVADIVGVLIALDRNNFVVNAGREFQEVVDGITATNKPGELIIKLKIAPSGWNTDTSRPNQVDVNPEIIAKVPKRDPNKSIFFITDDNKLTREDPAQEKMFG